MFTVIRRLFRRRGVFSIRCYQKNTINVLSFLKIFVTPFPITLIKVAELLFSFGNHIKTGHQIGTLTFLDSSGKAVRIIAAANHAQSHFPHLTILPFFEIGYKSIT
jgi:hypothetical protein